MIGKRELCLFFSFSSYIEVNALCLVPGFYGILCENRCGRCAGNGICDLLSGECRGCLPGNFGSKCKMNCPSTCGGDGSCSQFTAVCENGCQPGFTGMICDHIITPLPPPSPASADVWEPIAVTIALLVVTIAGIIVIGLLCRRKNTKTLSFYENQLVPAEGQNLTYRKLNETLDDTRIRLSSTGSYSKDRTGNEYSTIDRTQRDIDYADFGSDSHYSTMQRNSGEGGDPGGQPQTYSEPHSYIYVIST